MIRQVPGVGDLHDLHVWTISDGFPVVTVHVVLDGLAHGTGVARAVSERLQAEYVKHSAMKRRGRASEIAAIVAFFALDDTYVTGQTIAVDGGFTAQ